MTAKLTSVMITSLNLAEDVAHELMARAKKMAEEEFDAADDDAVILPLMQVLATSYAAVLQYRKG